MTLNLTIFVEFPVRVFFTMSTYSYVLILEVVVKTNRYRSVVGVWEGGKEVSEFTYVFHKNNSKYYRKLAKTTTIAF